jgi:hypothetical protein
MKSPRGLKVIPVKKVASLVVMTVFFVSGVVAQCPEGRVELAFDQDGYVGTLSLTPDASPDSYLYDLEITDPCGLTDGGIAYRSFQGADPVITIADSSYFDFVGRCEDGGITGTLTLLDPCDTNSGAPISTPVDGGGGTGGGDDGGDEGDDDGEGDGEDEDDGDDDGTGSGTGQVDERASVGDEKPVAQLIGIDVEINPSVLNITAQKADGIPDATFVARLIFSSDNVPEDFEYEREDWKFFPQIPEGGNWTDWGYAMEAAAYLSFLDWGNHGVTTGREKNFDQIAANALFDINLDKAQALAFTSKQIPIRASYTDEDGVEYSKVVNLRIAKKTKNRPVATSTGPSARVVTYSRILE